MSKRRSATSSSSQPERPVFFVDRSLGSRYVPDALRLAGVRVEVHGDHFPDDAADEVWLTAVGQQGWVVLTKDARIRRRPLELEALVAARVRAFIFTRANMKGQEVAEMLAGHVPTMLRWCSSRPGPFLVAITGSGLRLIRSE